MNCERMETVLIAYLDGRARDDERRDVEKHLSACAVCRTRAEEIRRLWGVLDEVPVIEPSPAFDARLRARIAAEPRTPWFAWLVPSPRLAFSTALLLVLGAWISTMPPVRVENQAAPAPSDEEFKMIRDLPVLEDYEILADFEPLGELPKPAAKKEKDQKL